MAAYEGQAFKIGGQEYIVPAVSLAGIRKLDEDGVFTKMGDIGRGGRMTKEQVDAALDIIHSAFKRNYPGTTREQLAEMVDMANLGPITRAIFGLSGLEEKKPGEAESP